MTIRAFGLCLALALGACAAQAPVANSPEFVRTAMQSTPIAQQLSALKERLLVLVEQERRRLNSNAKPLIIDPELMAAAQAHSDEMARNQSVDDDDPEGHFAINILLRDPKFGGFVAENAAVQQFVPAAGIDPNGYARSILDAWLRSQDHKDNLAYWAFDRTGIGLTANGNSIYASLVLATDFGVRGGLGAMQP